MINTIALFFTKEFQSEYELDRLLLGIAIGIVIVIVGIIIIAKKIINRGRQRKEKSGL